MQRARKLNLAASVIALSLALTAKASPAISDHERAVHHLVTAYFSGQSAAQLQHSLADSLSDADGDVPAILKSLADALTKLQVDGENGLSRFKEKDFALYARAVAYSDVTVARSTLTRLQTALDGRTVSPSAKDLLAQLLTQLSAIYAQMGGQ